MRFLPILTISAGTVLFLLAFTLIFCKNRPKNPIAAQTIPERGETLPVIAAAVSLTPTASEVPSATPTALPTQTPFPTPAPTLSAAEWRSWPILPGSISPEMKAVYLASIEIGNNPEAFSKVGDSNSMMPSFLSCFDYGDKGFTIGPYTDLLETIDHFRRSFSRESRATANGITAMGLDTYHWYEDEICWPYESATSCEYRLWKPTIAFIALGTNDAFNKPEDFDRHLRSLVQKSLDRFVVPILVFKADDVEGNGSFNQMIAQIALDFHVPVWNLWLALQPLPGHGLRENDVHPTFSNESLCDFSGNDLKQYGWTVRNLTGLQALDRVWRLLNAAP